MATHAAHAWSATASRGGEQVRQRGSSLSVFEAIGDDAKRQRFHFRYGLIASLTISEYARQVDNVREPAAVLFLLSLDLQRVDTHAAEPTPFGSGFSRDMKVPARCYCGLQVSRGRAGKWPFPNSETASASLRGADEGIRQPGTLSSGRAGRWRSPTVSASWTTPRQRSTHGRGRSCVAAEVCTGCCYGCC